MLLNNDTNSTLNGLFANHGKSNINATQNSLAGLKEEDQAKGTNPLENSHFLISNEENLSTLEQAKKGIIQQVLNAFMGNNSDNQATLFPSVDYNTNSVSQETANPYESQSMKETPYGFLYESTQEYYQKTTIDFSASATINTPQGQYNIEINFSYTKEVYEKHSTAIAMQNEQFANEPLTLNLDNDDYSLKDLKHLDLVFDAKKAEEMEEENKRNEALMNFLQKLFESPKDNEEYNKALEERNRFMSDVTVWERQDNSFELAAQTQNGLGMYFSHEKSEEAYMKASYDSNGNFSFQAGYSSYESSTFALSV